MRRSLVATLLVLVALTAAARLPLAVTDPLWLDEVASARVIGEPTLPAVLRQVRHTESTPPLWYVLTWTVRQAGDSSVSIAALRLLSVLFACGLTVLTTLFARRFVPLAWACLAGLVVVLGPDFVAHGAELRAYTLFALLTVAFAHLLVSCAERPTRTRVASLALVTAAGCLTHYFFFLTLAAGLAWVWRERARAAAIAVGVGTLPFLAWAPAFVSQYRHRLYAFSGPFSLRDVVYLSARAIGILTSRGPLDAGGRLLVAALVAAGAVVASRRGNLLPALLAVVPLATGAAIWAVGPRIFVARNFLGAAPFAAICVAILFASLPRRVGAGLAASATLALVGSYVRFQVDWGRAPYDRISAALVAEGWTSRDAVLQFGPAPEGLMAPVGWYLPGRPLAVGCPRPRLARFVISYDALGGPRWLRRHAGEIAAEQMFPAYDHSPRGPSARQAIVVARLAAEAGGAPGGRFFCFRT